MRACALSLRLAMALLTAGPAWAQEAGVRAYQVDPERSLVHIHVGKSGLFSFVAGHEHEVETRSVDGRVQYDGQDPLLSSISLRIDASSLRVTGRGEPAEDVPEVQRVMLSDRVLDVQQYPAITFESTSISRGSNNSSGYVVTGNLTIKDVTRAVEAPVELRMDGNTLTATGNLEVEQTAFGIEPVSVAGVVNVKDELEITFTIVAALAPGTPR